MKRQRPLPISISGQVEAALRQGGPVVAIESAIVSPNGEFPRNLDLYLAVEAVLHARGVTPAVVAVVDGLLRVGLTRDELNRLAQGNPAKAARRDLAVVLAGPGLATTTVSSGLLGAE